MSRKPILSLDFDGVLHSYTTKWQGADVIPDPPVDGAREFLVEALKKFDVQVYSTRSHQEGGKLAMLRWCKQHFGAEIANKLGYPTFKPPALVMIDDRAFRFEGVWPDVDELRAFKPWNKR